MSIIKKSAVVKLVNLSTSTIDRKVKDGTFPQPIRLSTRSIAWREKDVQQWLNDRATEANLPVSE